MGICAAESRWILFFQGGSCGALFFTRMTHRDFYPQDFHRRAIRRIACKSITWLKGATVRIPHLWVTWRSLPRLMGTLANSLKLMDFAYN